MPLDALKLVRRDHERSKGDPMDREWFEIDADTLFQKTIPYFETLRAGDEPLTPHLQNILGYGAEIQAFTDEDLALLQQPSDAKMTEAQVLRRAEVIRFIRHLFENRLMEQNGHYGLHIVTGKSGKNRWREYPG